MFLKEMFKYLFSNCNVVFFFLFFVLVIFFNSYKLYLFYSYNVLDNHFLLFKTIFDYAFLDFYKII